MVPESVSQQRKTGTHVCYRRAFIARVYIFPLLSSFFHAFTLFSSLFHFPLRRPYTVPASFSSSSCCFARGAVIFSSWLPMLFFQQRSCCPWVICISFPSIICCFAVVVVLFLFFWYGVCCCVFVYSVRSQLTSFTLSCGVSLVLFYRCSTLCDGIIWMSLGLADTGCIAVVGQK